MSHSYTSLPSYDTTSPSTPTMARSRSTNAGLSVIAPHRLKQTAVELTPVRARALPAQSRSGGRQRRVRRRRARSVGRGAKPPPSLDLPGISRGQQLGDVAGPALRDLALLLPEDHV